VNTRFDTRGISSDILKSKRGALWTWGTLTATNQNAILDELGLWMLDSKNSGVAGKMRQTSARKMRCPNNSASGNHLGQNDPHPPEVGDRSPWSKFR
jgi:hypothetical protein